MNYQNNKTHMKVLKTYGDYINEVNAPTTVKRTEVINEMTTAASYVQSKRKPGDVEDELQDLIYSKNNIRKVEEDIEKEMTQKYHDTILPIWEKYLPSGLTVLHPRETTFYKKYYNNLHIIYEVKSGSEMFSISLNISDSAVTLDTLSKNAYINYYTTQATVDTFEIDRLIYLGKTAEAIGSAKSPFYKEWFAAAIALKEEENSRMESAGNVYEIERKLKEVFSEYLSVEFQESLYRNAVYNYGSDLEQMPVVNTSRSNRRGDKVKSVRVDRLKRTNVDVTYVTVGYDGIETEVEDTWQMSRLFKFWLENTRDGKETANEYSKDISIYGLK